MILESGNTEVEVASYQNKLEEKQQKTTKTPKNTKKEKQLGTTNK